MSDDNQKCHDCAASPGKLHSPGCDTERCPCCFGQLISCGCGDVYHPNWIEEEDKEGKYWWPPDEARSPWTGVMYEKEQEIAIRDNKYVRWLEVGEGFANDTKNVSFKLNEKAGWFHCDKSHPDARPDLNYGAAKIIKSCAHI